MSDERRVRETGGDVAPIVETSAGLYCMIHGRVDCTEPWCWACGNHLMDEWGRCADPKCRASNGSQAQTSLAAVRESWDKYGPGNGEPCPIEYEAMFIGYIFWENIRRAKGEPRHQERYPYSDNTSSSGTVGPSDPPGASPDAAPSAGPPRVMREP